MSHAVSLHPMAVLLVVAAAGSVAGIPGAVFGVPIAAFLNATFLYLHGYDPMPELAKDRQRPGGPPEMLDDLVKASYAGKALPGSPDGGAAEGAGSPAKGESASASSSSDSPRAEGGAGAVGEDGDEEL
ncbi:MAG: AI-2E family transporter, partial [Schaalia hyovaginalis]|nr:AI-2E family transporter [Schaalia hyovaginalis]